MIVYPYKQEMEVSEKLTEIINQVIEKNGDIDDNKHEKDEVDKHKEKDEVDEHKEKDEVELLLEEIIQKLCEKTSKKKRKLTKKASKDQSMNECINEENTKTEPECPNVKGILKPRRCHCCTNNHVDFVHAPQMIRAYDETKDFTIDIQFVEEHPKKVVSYRKLFAEQRKAENSAQEIQDR